MAKTEGVTNLVEELAGIAKVVGQSAALRDVLADKSIPPNSKTLVVSHLFGSKVSIYALRIFNEAVLLEHPGRLIDVLPALEILLGSSADPSTGALTTTSRVRGFARAVLSSISDTNRLRDIEERIFEFRNVVELAPKLRRALSGIGTNAEQRVQIIGDLIDDAFDDFFVEIIRFAASTGRIRDYVEVLDRIGVIAADMRAMKIAKVHVARPFSQEQAARVSEAIKVAYGSAVELREIIDASIIGGILTIVGDTIFDGSVKFRLDQLRDRLSVATSAR